MLVQFIIYSYWIYIKFSKVVMFMRKNCGFSNCYLEGPRGEKDAIEVRKTKTLPPDRKAIRF